MRPKIEGKKKVSTQFTVVPGVVTEGTDSLPRESSPRTTAGNRRLAHLHMDMDEYCKLLTLVTPEIETRIT